MRVLPVATIVALSLLAAGCAKSSDASAASAAATPAGPTVHDKRTGLPIYPGAVQSSTSDSQGTRMTSFMSADSQQSVAAFYKTALPASFTLNDQSASSNGPTMEFDKNVHSAQSGDHMTARVYLSTVGNQTAIDLETFK